MLGLFFAARHLPHAEREMWCLFVGWVRRFGSVPVSRNGAFSVFRDGWSPCGPRCRAMFVYLQATNSTHYHGTGVSFSMCGGGPNSYTAPCRAVASSRRRGLVRTIFVSACMHSKASSGLQGCVFFFLFYFVVTLLLYVNAL